MTRPAVFLSGNQGGVGLDPSQMCEAAARSSLLHGDRQQRRAAKRWLHRHRRDLEIPLTKGFQEGRK